MRPPRIWTDNELQDVLTRISHGESVRNIAHYYHTSDDALYTMLSYRGYSVRSLRTSGAIQSHTLHGLAPCSACARARSIFGIGAAG
jgi:hypothetical protein